MAPEINLNRSCSERANHICSCQKWQQGNSGKGSGGGGRGAGKNAFCFELPLLKIAAFMDRYLSMPVIS